MPTHHRARSHASRDASSRASTTKRRHDFFPITPGASHRPRPPPSAPHRHHPPTPIARARPPRRVASIRRAAFARAASTDADPDAHRIASHRIASRTFKHRPLIAAEADIANMANGGSRVTSSDDARARRGEGRGGEARRRSRRRSMNRMHRSMNRMHRSMNRMHRSMNRMHRSMNRPIDRCVDRSIGRRPSVGRVDARSFLCTVQRSVG